ncbi:cleft lip and palate transmembrane protein 1 homolog, partial [Tachysurus ichikawai]
VVFFIYLYQRWIYRVDPNRVNEFGTSGVVQSSENSAQASVGDTANAAITDKPEEEKKND